MFKPLTLIVVTLAVVGSNVESNDPAYASPSKVIIQEVKADKKVVEQKGRKETLASKSSRSRNLTTVRIPLGKPRFNKVFAQVYIEQKYRLT